VVIAADATVEDDAGREEGAWGDGTRFVERGNWAMYFTYEVQSLFDCLAAGGAEAGGACWFAGVRARRRVLLPAVLMTRPRGTSQVPALRLPWRTAFRSCARSVSRSQGRHRTRIATPALVASMRF
jgi:hypothetical protein